jgi:hypothetical protein
MGCINIKVILTLVFLFGRISLAAHYPIGQEDKRVINCQEVSQISFEIITAALQDEKITGVCIRKKQGLESFFGFKSEKKYPVLNSIFLETFSPYFGTYIDPPKLA